MILAGVSVCALVRLMPFRPPNIEPILAVQLPFAHAYGRLTGFLFGVTSIVLFDFMTGHIGIWTLCTAAAYGAVGFFAATYFQGRAATARSYAVFAIASTLAYDAVTGLVIGPVFFGQPFWAAAVGQVPFTLMHLVGNVSFALVLSPALYRSIVERLAAKALSTATLLAQHN